MCLSFFNPDPSAGSRPRAWVHFCLSPRGLMKLRGLWKSGTMVDVQKRNLLSWWGKVSKLTRLEQVVTLITNVSLECLPQMHWPCFLVQKAKRIANHYWHLHYMTGLLAHGCTCTQACLLLCPYGSSLNAIKQSLQWSLYDKMFCFVHAPGALCWFSNLSAHLLCPWNKQFSRCEYTHICG